MVPTSLNEVSELSLRLTITFDLQSLKIDLLPCTDANPARVLSN